MLRTESLEGLKNNLLTSLDLSHYSLDTENTMEALKEALKVNTSLRNLSFRQDNHGGNKHSASIFITIIKNSQLQSLEITGWKGSKIHHLLALCRRWLTSLQTLNLSQSKLDLEHVIDCLRALPNLKKLSLVSCNINDAMIKNIVNTLPLTLQCLYLGDNQIGPQGARAIAKMLVMHPSLTEIKLSRNTIQNEGAQYLATALPHNHTLKRLEISNNSIGEEGTYALATSLQKNVTLQELVFSYLNSEGENLIGVRGEQALQDIFSHNGSLFYVSIGQGHTLGRSNQTLAPSLHALEHFGSDTLESLSLLKLASYSEVEDILKPGFRKIRHLTPIHNTILYNGRQFYHIDFIYHANLDPYDKEIEYITRLNLPSAQYQRLQEIFSDVQENTLRTTTPEEFDDIILLTGKERLQFNWPAKGVMAIEHWARSIPPLPEDHYILEAYRLLQALFYLSQRHGPRALLLLETPFNHPRWQQKRDESITEILMMPEVIEALPAHKRQSYFFWLTYAARQQRDSLELRRGLAGMYTPDPYAMLETMHLLRQHLEQVILAEHLLNYDTVLSMAKTILYRLQRMREDEPTLEERLLKSLMESGQYDPEILPYFWKTQAFIQHLQEMFPGITTFRFIEDYLTCQSRAEKTPQVFSFPETVPCIEELWSTYQTSCQVDGKRAASSETFQEALEDAIMDVCNTMRALTQKENAAEVQQAISAAGMRGLTFFQAPPLVESRRLAPERKRSRIEAHHV